MQRLEDMSFSMDHECEFRSPVNIMKTFILWLGVIFSSLSLHGCMSVGNILRGGALNEAEEQVIRMVVERDVSTNEFCLSSAWLNARLHHGLSSTPQDRAKFDSFRFYSLGGKLNMIWADSYDSILSINKTDQELQRGAIVMALFRRRDMNFDTGKFTEIKSVVCKHNDMECKRDPRRGGSLGVVDPVTQIGNRDAPANNDEIAGLCYRHGSLWDYIRDGNKQAD